MTRSGLDRPNFKNWLTAGVTMADELEARRHREYFDPNAAGARSRLMEEAEQLLGQQEQMTRSQHKPHDGQ
jgi:hypothetical protein